MLRKEILICLVITLAITSVITLAITSVVAQTKRTIAKPTPKATPVSEQPALTPATDLAVFGIKLGSPLNLPECKGIVLYDEYEMEKPHLPLDKVCYQVGPFKTMTDESQGVLRWVNFPYEEQPNIVKGWTITVTIINGKVEGVAFPTAGVDSDTLVLSTLKKKYGEPKKLTTAKVQNRMGAVFDSITAVWSFSNLVVAFESVGSTIDKGLVNIDTPSGFAWRHKPKPEKRPL